MRLPVVAFPCEEEAARVGGVLHCYRCQHDLVEWLRLSEAEQSAILLRIRAGEQVCLDVPARPPNECDDWSDVQSEIDGATLCS